MIIDDDAAARRIVDVLFGRCADVLSTNERQVENDLGEDIARNSFVRANIERWPL